MDPAPCETDSGGRSGEPPREANVVLSTLSPAALRAHDHAMQQDNKHVSSLGTVNILLVEDDENQRVAILALFEAANEKNGGSVAFSVTTASNGSEALDFVTSDPSRFNLILLDMMLPDTNGYDLLPRLRSVVGGDVAIVMASANSQMSLVQLCVKRGADAFLVKPLGSEEVRHLWQFIKDLPDGSFKKAVENTRASFVNKDGRSPDGGDEGASYDYGPSVLAQAGALGGMQMDSIVVCAGFSGAASAPGSTADADHEMGGIVRVRMPSSDDGRGVARRATHESGASSCSGLEDTVVGADCKQS